MLKKIVNHASIELRIIPLDPLLIKSGQATISGVNLAFVRTSRSGGQDQPYIPGSSLKGVIRSYAEKICRSLRDHPVPVCLPYLKPGQEQAGEEDQASCGLRFEKYKKDRKIQTIHPQDVYRLSCPVCRLFGSHSFVGRFAASDAYLIGDSTLEIRDGVAIDRLTGGTAGGAKYDLEVLTKGEFKTTVEIRNFERWQLGLIALVLRDLEQGLVRLGSGKSRGLGKSKADITRFQVTYYNQPRPVLTGLAGLCSEAECESYGYFQESSNHAPALPEPQINGLRREYDLTDTWKDAVAPAVDDLVAYVSQVEWPRGLENYTRRR
ncbi:MAG: CRISPR-associated RAMP protein [Deltaproteobacteria bacterium]|nr:CRISPR-associated RAMP protein [Deltaproteobacteria bacterium]